MKISKLFTEHPASVGETYVEHFFAAASFGLSMLAGGLLILVHSVLPFLFVKTGSAIVRGLYQRMISSRHRSKRPAMADGEIILNFEI